MSSGINQMLVPTSNGANKSMNSFMLGSFAMNFLISFSMKKLLQAIRVLQLIAFMIFLEINYTPIAKYVI